MVKDIKIHLEQKDTLKKKDLLALHKKSVDIRCTQYNYVMPT